MIVKGEENYTKGENVKEEEEENVKQEEEKEEEEEGRM
jgi:hypothetical protein